MDINELNMIGILPWNVIKDHEADITVFLNRALQYNGGEQDLQDVYEGLETGEYVCFGEFLGGKITTVFIINMIHYPIKKQIYILLGAGVDLYSPREEFLHKICEFAKTNDCDSIAIHGRRGWIKVLQDYGFKQPYVVLERKL